MSTEILRLLEENMDTIKEFGVEEIGLFGSYAKNTQTENSDVDILVKIKKSEQTFDNYMGLKFFLENLLKKNVDLVLDDNLKPALESEIRISVRHAKL